MNIIYQILANYSGSQTTWCVCAYTTKELAEERLKQLTDVEDLKYREHIDQVYMCSECTNCDGKSCFYPMSDLYYFDDDTSLYYSKLNCGDVTYFDDCEFIEYRLFEVVVQDTL